jgi:spermidine synthase
LNSKKLISYVWPSVIEKGITALGQSYEVNFENGVKVLNSENTNYSFGSLHQIMLKGIDEVLRTLQPKSVLMLGLGAGSAISILKQKCPYEFKLKAIEIDEELIALARKHFNLDEMNAEVVNMDARLAIKDMPSASFDLIIDDVFWDNQVPAFCKEETYLKDNARLLTANGVYMRNIMAESRIDSKFYEENLSKVFKDFYSLKHKTYGNKIYFCKQ